MTDQNTREMHYTILGYDLENLENSSEPKSATRKAFTSGFLPTDVLLMMYWCAAAAALRKLADSGLSRSITL